MNSPAATRALSDDTDRRFGGVQRLYGQAGYARISAAEVCVIGLGGVGSWAVEALARSGIGGLILVDLDHVAVSNVNRQIHALTSELGRAKTEAMAGRVHDINPHCRLHLIDDHVTEQNVAELLGKGADYVIDCTDDFRIKAAIVAWCRRRKQRVITVGGAGGLTEPQRIRVADLTRSVQDPLLARTRKFLRYRYGWSHNPKRRFDVPCVYSDEQLRYPTPGGSVCRQKPADRGMDLSCAGGLGSVVTVTATFGLVAASHVLKKLTGDNSVPDRAL